MRRTIDGPDKNHLTVKEAAEWLSVPESTLEAMIQEQLIPRPFRVSQRVLAWSWQTVVAIQLVLPFLSERHAEERKKRRETSPK